MTIENASEGLSAAVEAAAQSVVHVSAGCRHSASGTVWSEKHVVTTHRDLANEDTVRVVLADGSRREARVVGRDPGLDVALLEVEGGGLSVPRVRDAANAKVGELVIALGRPGRSVRASLRMIGVVAADVPTEGGALLRHYVETDRAIPTGFSGGPLLDASGAVLGIQSAGLVRNADLVVPTEALRDVVSELESHGRVRTGLLGVSVHGIRLPKAAEDVLGRRRGALVMAVAPGSAAENAGIHLGDVIVELEGDPIASGRSLARALRSRFDREVKLRLWRTGQLVDITATLQTRG